LANMYAFFLDRVEQVDKVVGPALLQGKAVVSDRWHYSTTAYQFYGKEIMERYGLTQEVADWLNSSAELGCKPDITYYFPEKITKPIGQRISDSGKFDLFETPEEAFLRRVNEGYESLAARPDLNFKRVKLYPTPEETLKGLLEIDF